MPLNISPDGIDMVAAEVVAVSAWSKTDAAILIDLLNHAVPNPVPRGQVSNPITEPALYALLTDPANGSLGKLTNWPNLALLRDDIKIGDKQAIINWAGILSSAGIGIITAGEAQAIENYVNGTMPDPAYQSTVPYLLTRLGRAPDIGDIEATRAAKGL